MEICIRKTSGDGGIITDPLTIIAAHKVRKNARKLHWYQMVYGDSYWNKNNNTESEIDPWWINAKTFYNAMKWITRNIKCSV